MKNHPLSQTIANISLILVPLVYLGMHLVIRLSHPPMDFGQILALIMVGGSVLAACCVISILARSLWLHQNPAARRLGQKTLLGIPIVLLMAMMLSLLWTF